MASNFVRNVIVASLVAMVMVLAFSVGFAYLNGGMGAHGSWSAPAADRVVSEGQCSHSSCGPQILNVSLPDPAPEAPAAVEEPVPEEEPEPAGDAGRVVCGLSLCSELDGAETAHDYSDPPDIGQATAGGVDRIIDPDTLSINGRILNLTMVRTNAHYGGAYSALNSFCPVGGPALYVIDVGLGTDGYGSPYAKVWCGQSGTGVSVNALLLQSGGAELARSACSGSSFGGEVWARVHGC